MNPRALAFRMPEEVSYLQPASRKWQPLDLPDPGNEAPALHPVYRRAVAPVTPRGSWWSALTKLRIFP